MLKKHYCIFSDNLRIDKAVHNPGKVKRKLCHGAGMFTIYCITAAQSDGDQLDIIHAAFLQQNYYKDHPVFVYAIACSYEAAIDMLIEISDEAAECGMPGQVRAYLDKADKRA